MNLSNRQLFAELGLFKKEVTERFLSVTREIYSHHPVYNYVDEERDSNILIYPSYADTEYDGKQARIIVKPGSYNYHLLDTMYNNMSGEVRNEEGVVIGYKHSQILQIPITVLIHAYAEEESSNIADELASIVVYACRRAYSSAGLVIRGMQVSETDMYNQEQKIYQTTATISLDVPWSSQSTKLDLIDEIITDVELEKPLTFDTYRSPGVSVFKEKRP